MRIPESGSLRTEMNGVSKRGGVGDPDREHTIKNHSLTDFLMRDSWRGSLHFFGFPWLRKQPILAIVLIITVQPWDKILM
jgi:hypothetical protein